LRTLAFDKALKGLLTGTERLRDRQPAKPKPYKSPNGTVPKSRERDQIERTTRHADAQRTRPARVPRVSSRRLVARIRGPSSDLGPASQNAAATEIGTAEEFGTGFMFNFCAAKICFVNLRYEHREREPNGLLRRLLERNDDVLAVTARFI